VITINVINNTNDTLHFSGAIDALSLKGACLQSSWPFQLDQVNRAPPEEAFTQAMHYKISEAKEVPPTLTAMRACLAEGFPIIFGLKLTKKVTLILMIMILIRIH
jgi:hypothetical protein